jgi:hypothetical protein
MSRRQQGVPKPKLQGRKRPEHGAKARAAWTSEMREEARIRGLAQAENRDWLMQIAESLAGENNPNYQGKNRTTGYAPGWGRGYRQKIRARAEGTCERCDARPDYPLDLHHRDFTKTNHAPENLMALCRSCHKLLHAANSRKT